MKKMLLGLGSIALTMVPVVTVISCSHEKTATVVAPSMAPATATETQKAMMTSVNKANIVHGLNGLKIADLADHAKVSAAILKAMPTKYAGVINGITAAVYTPATSAEGSLSTEVVTLTAAVTGSTTKAAIKVTFEGVVPSKDANHLEEALLNTNSLDLQTTLALLPVKFLKSKAEVINAIKSVVTAPEYQNVINDIVSVEFTEAVTAGGVIQTPSKLVITIANAIQSPATPAVVVTYIGIVPHTDATNAETHAALSVVANGDPLRTALNQLTIAELQVPSNVITAIKSVLVEPKYTTVLDSITTTSFSNGILIITLSDGYVIHYNNIGPQKTAAELKGMMDITQTVLAVQGELNKLTMAELDIKGSVILQLKLAIPDPTYDKAIDGIINVKYTPAVPASGSTLQVFAFEQITTSDGIITTIPNIHAIDE